MLDSERGKHMTYDYINHQKVKAFVLEPLGYQCTSQNSENLLEESLHDHILDVSGERIPYAPIQVEIHPKLANLIVPSWLDDNRWHEQFTKQFGNFRNK